MEDANGSAKLVLVAIQKSRAAIERMQANEPADDFTGLTSALVTLERGIEARFPDARTYVRVCTVVAGPGAERDGAAGDQAVWSA